MPSWGTHIYIASKLCENFNIDRNEFIVGNILPDVFVGWIIENPSKIKSYKETHFAKITTVSNTQYLLPDFSNYEYKINDAISLGYYTHILTDYFFNKYTFENKFVKDDSNNFIGYKLGKKLIKCDKDEALSIKQDDFQILSNNLITEVNIEEFNIDKRLRDKLINLEYSNKDIDKIYNYIINIKENVYSEKLKLKMFNIKELELLTQNCIEYIIEKIKINPKC